MTSPIKIPPRSSFEASSAQLNIIIILWNWRQKNRWRHVEDWSAGYCSSLWLGRPGLLQRQCSTMSLLHHNQWFRNNDEWNVLVTNMTHQWQWVRLVSDVSDQSVPLDVTDDVTGDGSDDGSRELEVTGLTQQYKYNHNCCCQLILWYRSIWPCVTSFLLSASSSSTERRIAFKHMIRFHKQDETPIKIGKVFKNQKERKKLNFWSWRNACKEVMANKTSVACKTSYF